MIYNEVYQCPKCFNTLLVSNKLLHDLRCTVENPATYENILFRQSLQMSNDSSPNIYKSISGGRTSFKNKDGTMTDIVREKNIRGKEELIETKYDPQGNIITRKRADTSGFSLTDSNIHEYSEITLNNYDNNDYDTRYDNNNNTYYEVNKEVEEVRKKPSVIVETAEAQEIVIEAPAKYDPHVTINQPIYGDTIINSKSGYSNSGQSKSGYSNTGYSKSGYSNSNSGYSKSGYSNSGYSNTGYSKTGYSKTGYSKTGYSKTGYSKSGYSNTGYSNTGYNDTTYDNYTSNTNNNYSIQNEITTNNYDYSKTNDYTSQYKSSKYNKNYDYSNFDNQFNNTGANHTYSSSYNLDGNKKYSKSKTYSEFNSSDYQY
jgi:hypothetical protein